MIERDPNTSTGCSKCGAPFKEACMCPSEGEAKVIDINQRLAEKNTELPAEDVADLPADGEGYTEEVVSDERKEKREKRIEEIKRVEAEIKKIGEEIKTAREKRSSYKEINLLEGKRGNLVLDRLQLIDRLNWP